VFHYAAILLVIAQGILLTPLYLSFLSPALYGGWLATGNIVAWIGLVDPGVSRIMQQRVAYTLGRRDMDGLRAALGTGLMLGSMLSLLPLMALPFSGVIVGTLSLSTEDHHAATHAFRLSIVGLCLMIAGYQPAAANVAIQRGFLAGMSYTIGGVLGIATSISLLLAGFGLASLPLGMIVRSIVMLVGNVGSLLVWRRQHLSKPMVVHKKELSQYARLSMLTFLERLGSALLTHSDAYLTAKLVSPEQATVYSLTGRAFDPARMAAERVAPAFLPSLAHLAGEGRRERLYEIANRLFDVLAFVISVGAAAVVALNFAFVPLWVGPDFFGGQSVTMWLACFVVMNVILSSLAEIVFAAGGVGQVEVMRAIEGVVRVATQLVMLQWLGVIGIPIGGCLGMLVVSAWYLPQVAAVRLDQKPAVFYLQIVSSGLRAAVLLALGSALGWGLEQNIPHWNWPMFFGSGVIVGLTLSAAGLAMNRGMRNELAGFVAWYRQKTARKASR
jgi:O-antigen/teichoic acid export membrane protein